jgi:hypothetical protein
MSTSPAADTQKDGESNAARKPELAAGVPFVRTHNQSFASRTLTRWEIVVHARVCALSSPTPLHSSTRSRSMIQHTENKKIDGDKSKSGENKNKSRENKKTYTSMDIKVNKHKRFINRR